MKILLIGPCPPPHGGISVHVAGIQRQLAVAGVTCRVLDMNLVRPGWRFGATVLRHAFTGWTLHFHTNGHNVKSWLLAFGCGVAGQARGGCVLTLHSGLAPSYLAAAPPWRRRLAAFTCSLYRKVICVSPEIGSALLPLGLEPRRMEVLPAFVSADGRGGAPQSELLEWIGRHRPLFSTVLFYRPEYGFDVLVAALQRLSVLHASLGCLVMGSGEQRAQAERSIRDAGLEESTLLLGDVDHDACLALMSACDVFLRPTLEDGDSISVREAMALGIPVVASRAGARPPGAILFRPGDAEEMAAKVEVALLGKGRKQTQAAGCEERLLEIYRQLDAAEGGLCVN